VDPVNGSGLRQANETRKPATDKVSSKSRRDCQWFAPVLRELQSIFKTQFARELNIRTGRDPRVIQKWKTGRHAPDGEALNSLINSDIGDRVLLALTRSNAQAWAQALRRTHEIAQLRRVQAETQSRLEALERGLA